MEIFEIKITPGLTLKFWRSGIGGLVSGSPVCRFTESTKYQFAFRLRHIGLLSKFFVRAHTGQVFFLNKTLTHWKIFFLKLFSTFKTFRYAEKILKHATSAICCSRDCKIKDKSGLLILLIIARREERFAFDPGWTFLQSGGPEEMLSGG